MTMNATADNTPPVSPYAPVQAPSRTWEVLTHLSGLAVFTAIPSANILAPLFCWLLKRGNSPSVDAHGREVLNFHISWSLYLLFFGAFTGVTMILLIGFLLLPFLILGCLAFPLVMGIFSVIGALKASDGELYRYPLTIRFF